MSQTQPQTVTQNQASVQPTPEPRVSSPAPSSESQTSATKHVLLVEDDVFLSSILKSRLEKEGMTVIHARDGQEAIDMLKTQKPDVILLDLILPKKSGFEVMEQIRQDPQLENAPIIIISNLGQPEDIEKGKNLGAVEYFIKAKTSIEDLVKNVMDFLANMGHKGVS